MPMIAVRIGRPMAITEPNAMSSTMIAARMPMTSLAGIAASPNQLPANSTCTPSLASGAASAFTLSAVSFGCVPEPDAVVIGTTATLPPREISIGCTAITPWTCLTFAMYALIAGRSLVTSAKTICASSPWRWGKSCFRVSYAACESVLGNRPDVADSPLSAGPPTIASTNPTIQSTTTTRRWR